jgi:hypothetical protein
MDLVIAVVVFGFMAVIFYSLVIIQDQPSVEELEDNAEKINAKLEQGLSRCGSIIDGQTITQEQLQCLFGYNYDELKNELGIDGDFCIYLESTEGGLYVLHNSTAGNKTAFGNPTLVVSGTPCGQTIAVTSGGIKQSEATQGETRCVVPENLYPRETIIASSATLRWDSVQGAVSYNVRIYNTSAHSTQFHTANAQAGCDKAYRCALNIPTNTVTNVPVEMGATYRFTVEPVFSPARDNCFSEQFFPVGTQQLAR